MVNLILHFLFSYFLIGVVIAIISDITIRFLKSSELFTFGDIWACIMFWPIVITGFIKGYINGEN